MTTIAWDGQHLAADRIATGGGPICIVRKITRGKDGRLVGAAGQTAACQALIAWIAGGEEGDSPVPLESNAWTEILMVSPDGRLWCYGDHGKFEIHNDRIAIGSGAQYALGAMACGKSAAEAVAVASLFDCCTGAEADVLSLVAVMVEPARKAARR